MLLDNYRKIYLLLSKQERKKLFFIIIFMCFVAVLEFISLGALIPFLHVMMEIESADKNWILDLVSGYYTFTPLELTIGFISLAFVSAIARMLLLRHTAKHSQEIGRRINLLIFSSVYNELITNGKSKKTSDILTSVATKTAMVVNQAVWPAITITSAALISSVVAAMVISVSPLVGSAVIVSFGALFLLLSKYAKYRLAENSLSISVNSNKLLSSLDDTVRGYRDLTIYQADGFLKTAFEESTADLAAAHASNQFLSGMPRFIVEGSALVVIALVSYFFLVSEVGLTPMLPELAFFVLAAQKIMPLMQQVYGAVSAIRSGVVSVNDNLNLISLQKNGGNEIQKHAGSSMGAIVSCELANITIRNSFNNLTLLDDASFSANIGELVGIYGESGSGKSTLLDIICGLQPLKCGERFLTVSVNGKIVTDNSVSLSHFSYVSQSPFIISGTIAENVALCPRSMMSPRDRTKILSCLRKTGLSQFTSLGMGGLDYEVGEDGCLMSGGQIQRLAISRALYFNRDIILIDEGTSALDREGRDLFMEMLQDLKKQKIIIMVTHDHDLAKHFDKIYKIQGRNLLSVSSNDV